MKCDRFSAPARVILAVGALLALAAAGLFQCPALPLGDAARAHWTMGATLLSLLCVSVLIEDLVGMRLRDALRMRRAPLAIG